MPFIEPQDRTQREELKEKIRPEVIKSVEEYAQYLDSERWYVVQELLRKSIASDKDFQKWKAERAAVPLEVKTSKVA